MKKVTFLRITLVAGDIFFMYLAFFAAVLIRHKSLAQEFWGFFYHFLPLYIIWVFTLFVLALYDVYFFKKIKDFIFNLIIFSVAAFFTGVTYFYFLSTAAITPKTILLLNIIIFAVLFSIWRFAINIFFIPSPPVESHEMLHKKIDLQQINDEWVLNNISGNENILYTFVKRLIDVVFGSLGLLFCVLLFPFIALAIRIDDNGPVIYSQKRLGKNGKMLTIHKFRTMRHQTHQGKEVVREPNKDSVTAVGKILRKTHLDELPQAVGILKGELSFVGPRPEPAVLSEIFEKEVPFYKQRFLVKPGLFGWAQIHLPAYLSVEKEREKIEYDLYYIKNRSLLLDLEIMLKAIKLFFW